MFVSQPHSPTTLNGSHLRIGIVQARFNDGITNALAQACLDELAASLRRQRQMCIRDSPSPTRS
mgnify:CR=1 FL=1